MMAKDKTKNKKKSLTKTSKFLSLVLRHDPSSIGLTLDAEGWANVPDLISKMNISMKMLENIVDNDNKTRYAFNDAKTKVRANQGHSISVDLKLDPITPPDVLYHGTATSSLDSIYKSGIKSMNRQYVHLSGDIHTAANVGKRHGNVIVLKLDTKQMHEDDCVFYKSKNGVWLTDWIDSKYMMNVFFINRRMEYG